MFEIVLALICTIACLLTSLYVIWSIATWKIKEKMYADLGKEIIMWWKVCKEGGTIYSIDDRLNKYYDYFSRKGF